MRLPTFPSRRLANHTTDSLSLSAPIATPIAFLTATQTFTSPTPTITVSPSGTALEYPSSDEELSDWDSEDDEDLTWDDDIDGVAAEQLDCKKGGEDDSDDDSDDEDSEPKDARPPPHGKPQPQPSGETPVGNGTITCTSSLAPIAAPSATSTSLVLPSSAIPTTIVTSSIISSTTTTGTFSSSPSYTSSSLPTSSLSSTPIPISDSISTFVSPTPLSTLYTLTAGTEAIFGTSTTAIAAATSPAAPGGNSGNSGNNKTAAAGIAVGATAGVVFVASAAFILARIRLKRNKAASEASSTPSTPGAGDFPSPYMTRAVNLNAPPSPNPFTMSPTRRIMTNSELLDNVIAAAYAAEIVPNANRPVASTHASMMPPATVPGPAGAVYGYGYDDAESEVDDGMGPSRLSATLRVLVDPVAPVVVEQAAGDDTVMMWMGGMASPSLMDPNAPASPLPMTPGTEETPVGFGGLGVGMPVEHLDEPSFYDIDGVRILSAYASERMSGVTGSERPDSPWDYEGYGQTGLAPPGGYI